MKRILGSSVLSVILASTVGACSSHFYALTCQSDADCGPGLVCVPDGSYCKNASQVPITVGISAPLTGPVQDLGVRVLAGINLAFSEQNAQGGVRGRQLTTQDMDDESQPMLTMSNIGALVDKQDDPADPPNCPTTQMPPGGASPVASHRLARGPRAALAIMGTVGAPTTLQGVPLAIETQTLVFAPQSGSQPLLRDGSAGPCSRFVFTVRSGFAWEAEALVAYFDTLGITDSQHIFSFDQNNELGSEGFEDLQAALAGDAHFKGSIQPPQQIGGRFQYDFGSGYAQVDAAVVQLEAALTNLLKNDPSPSVPVGVFVMATYGPGAELVRDLRDWQNQALSQNPDLSRLRLNFGAESPIVLDSFVSTLKEMSNGGTYTDVTSGAPVTKAYWQDFVATQTVPNYQTDSGDFVTQYKAAANKFGVTPTATSLEGYLGGRLFVAGLLQQQGPLDAATLIPTFESMGNLWTSLGVHAGFGPTSHQYLKSVWGVKLDSNGSFNDVFYWEFNLNGPNQFKIYG